MIQLATTWDGVALLVTSGGGLSEDNKPVPQRERDDYSPIPMAEARELAFDRSIERYLRYMESKGRDYTLHPPIAKLEWKTYP